MIHESANKEGGKKKICIKMIKLYLKKLIILNKQIYTHLRSGRGEVSKL